MRKSGVGLKSFMKRKTKVFHYSVPGHTGLRIRKHVDKKHIKIKGKSPSFLKKLVSLFTRM